MLLNEIHNNRIQRLIEILLDRQEQHDSANNVQTNVQELLDEDNFERDNQSEHQKGEDDKSNSMKTAATSSRKNFSRKQRKAIVPETEMSLLDVSSNTNL